MGQSNSTTTEINTQTSYEEEEFQRRHSAHIALNNSLSSR